MNGDARDFDIVLWGATGFTGRLVAAHLAANYISGPTRLRVALAGRNQDKLGQVAREIRAPEIPLLTGDSFDRASLDRMAERTRVVMSTVGPYAKYGADLVAACVQHGTDYCDLTGETPFIHAMIQEHEAAAREAGARIVHSCGYDSIPSDLGTLMVQEAFKERYGHYASQVKAAIRDTKVAMSGGSMASVLHLVDSMKSNPGLRAILADPYALNPNGVRGPDRGDQLGVRFDRDLDSWTAPFMMAAINTRVVRRSQALMNQPWGPDFRYSEVVAAGRGVRGFRRSVAVTGGLVGAMASFAIPFVRPWVEKRLPGPGEGPSVEEMARGRFKTVLLALGGGKRLLGSVSDQRDPGYGSTAVMLSEAAVCLANSRAEGEVTGGVLTPATGMGLPLVERLRCAGLRFDIED